MEKKDRRGAGAETRPRRRKSGARPKAGVTAGAVAPQNEEASERFARDLLVRGEAASPDAEGKLPPNATHVVTGEGEDGTPKVKRVRYKAF